MALALTGGFVDTGISRNFTVSCTIQLVNLPANAGIPPWGPDHVPPSELLPGTVGAPLDTNWVYGDIDTQGIIAGETNFDIRIAGNHTSRPSSQAPGAPPIYQRVVGFTSPFVPPNPAIFGSPKWYYLELQDGLSVSTAPSSIYNFTATLTGARLGVRRQSIIPPIEPPEFWSNHELFYGWFLDGFSTLSIQCAGFSSGTLYWRGQFGTWVPPDQKDENQQPQGVGNLGRILVRGHGTVDDGVHEQIRFRQITSDAVAMDTADIHDSEPNILSAGAGNLDIRSPNGRTPDAAMAAPYRFKYDLDITKFGDGPLNPRILDNFVTPEQIYTFDGSKKTPQQPSLTTPVLAQHIVQITDHPRRTKQLLGPMRFDLQQAWCNEQDPTIKVGDRQIPIYGSPARHSPTQITPYRPLTWTVLPSVNVHRPNGLRPSNWVSSDTNLITVAETTNSAFHVIAVGGSVKRTFHTHWRNWTTKGDPLFLIDNYEITAHDWFGTGDDVFGWQHHGWLQLNITAPANPGSLTLAVEGVHFEVEDPHTTGQHRIDNYTRTETPFTFIYPLTLAQGANTLFVDLLCPASGGPVPSYYGRVDALRLSGFNPGTFPADYTITGMSLVARQPGYFKNDFGAPVQREDYDAIVWAQDGAFNLGNWPDKAFKTEQGNRGGGVRHVTPLTGEPSGIIQDSERSLRDFGTNLHKLEGITAVYDPVVFDAANRDGFGVALAPEIASDMWSIVPYARASPGSAFHPDCSPRIRQTVLANGFPFEVLVRWQLWAGIEDMVTAGGKRVGAGVTVRARRTDTGQVVASAVTDASGYAIIFPVPGELTYETF